jgi:hypothetical protein
VQHCLVGSEMCIRDRNEIYPGDNLIPRWKQRGNIHFS